MENAFELVRAAADAGAWAIKFQLYKADTIAVKDSPLYWDDKRGVKTQHESFSMSDKFPYDDYKKVADYAERMGIVFFATPFDEEAIECLERIGVPLYKIASADLTNKPLIQAVAETGKPILLSTGASKAEEVAAAVEWAGNLPELVVPLACTLTYPTPYADGHFARIEAMKALFPDFMVGMSDHTRGHEGGWMAAALGAVCIEKHYTMSQQQTDVPDHSFSLEPSHLNQLVRACNLAATMRGEAEVTPAESELAARQMARRSLVTRGTIAAGTQLTRKMLTAKRPGTGISPARIDEFVGKQTARDLADDAVLKEEDVEG